MVFLLRYALFLEYVLRRNARSIAYLIHFDFLFTKLFITTILTSLVSDKPNVYQYGYENYKFLTNNASWSTLTSSDLLSYLLAINLFVHVDFSQLNQSLTVSILSFSDKKFKIL